MSKNSSTCRILLTKSTDLTEEETFEINHSLGFYSQLLGEKTISGPDQINAKQIEHVFVAHRRIEGELKSFVEHSMNLNNDFDINIKFKA